MSIPCIETKCILFPACRNKNRICCDILYDYYGKHLLSKDDNIKEEFHKIFNAILQLTTKEHGCGYLFTPREYNYKQMTNHIESLREDMQIPFKIIYSPKKKETVYAINKNSL